MKGTVFRMNVNRDMIALKVDENDFTIIEASSDDFQLHDVVSWDAQEGLGSGEVYNESQGETVDVIFQNHNVLSSRLSRLLF